MKTTICNSLLLSFIFLFIGCANDNTTVNTTGTDSELPVLPVITLNNYYADIVNKVSQEELNNTLQIYELFGNKQTGSNQLEQVQAWIENTYTDLGYTDVKIHSFPFENTSSNNIVITKKGTKFPDTYVILDAHYDAVFKGTNDNGSGTAILLELAKLFKDIDTEYSLKFIHFSGEENGLIGSNAYVTQEVIPNNMDIRLVFNIDQVGGAVGKNNVLVCEKGTANPGIVKQASEAFTLALAEAAKLYSSVKTEIGNAERSDYIPFENNGEIITGIYEKNGDSNPTYHLETDLLENMDLPFFTEVTKATAGAMLHFTGAEEKVF